MGLSSRYEYDCSMAKGLSDDEGGGVIGVMPTPDGGTTITKGGNPIPKGVTPFSKGGPPATEDVTQIKGCGSPTRKDCTQIPNGGTPATKYGTRIAKCGIRTTESMWTPHKMTDYNAEPGLHLSLNVPENDPQADIDKCQGELDSGHWSNHKQTTTWESNEEIRFLTDTPTGRDEYEEVTKATEQALNKCHTKGRGVLWPMSAATVLKRCLQLIVIIWVAPLLAAFIDISGPTSIYAGCTLQLRCEGRYAKNLLWWQGLGGDKRCINPSARYEIDGPSRSRPSGVVSTTLKIRNVSEEDSGFYSCYDGKGHHGFQHKVEVLPEISCGSFTPPDDMWVEYHCDHVTVGCKNNSGSWLLQCLNGTWQDQYGPCHTIETPIVQENDCAWQIAVTSFVFIFIGVVVIAVVICKGWRKKRSITLTSTKAKVKEDCVDSCWV